MLRGTKALLWCVLGGIGVLQSLSWVPAWASSPTQTSLAITQNSLPVQSVSQGTVVTLSATVTSSGSPVFPGQVQFCDAAAPQCTGGHLLATAQLTSAGMATLRLRAATGEHSYRAIFAGTNIATGSASAPIALEVQPNGSSVSRTATDLTYIGQPGSYTLTATLQGTGGAALTGTVSFLDTENADYLLGSAPVVVGASGLSLSVGPSYPTGASPSSVVAADFNGDGIPDLAVTNVAAGFFTPGSLSVLLGNGDGTFRNAVSLPTGADPAQLTTADFNNDGIPDLVYTTRLNGNIAVLLGNGDGTFRALPEIAGSSMNSAGVSIGDLNGDGNVDLATVDPYTGLLSVYLGRGDGTFTQVPQQSAAGRNPTSVAIGDFNGDGKQDAVVCNVLVPGNGVTPSSLTVFFGNGDGTFNTAQTIPLNPGAEQVLATDFNGDGILDLAVAHSGATPQTLTILLGTGDGTFVQQGSDLQIPFLSAIASGDLNGDGVVDLVGFLGVGPVDSQNVYALLGVGDGTFATITAADGGIPQTGVLADVNGDGWQDVVVADQTSGVIILTSVPTGVATATLPAVSIVGTGDHAVVASYSGDSQHAADLSAPVDLQAETVATTLTLTASSSISAPGANVTLTANANIFEAQNHQAGGLVTFLCQWRQPRPGCNLAWNCGAACDHAADRKRQHRRACMPATQTSRRVPPPVCSTRSRRRTAHRPSPSPSRPNLPMPAPR